MENETINPPQLDLKPLLKKLILFFVLIAIAVGYIWYSKKDERLLQKRQAELEALTRSSDPITATVEERGKSLQDLSKKSAPVTESVEDRLNALNALSRE